jgi:hypothetical protein
MPTPPVEKGGYTFAEAKTATTFSRATWYRWEKQGFVKLLRPGNKTLVPGDVINRLLSGELKLPSGHRARHWQAPQNNATPPRRKGGRPRKLAPTHPRPTDPRPTDSE